VRTTKKNKKTTTVNAETIEKSKGKKYRGTNIERALNGKRDSDLLFEKRQYQGDGGDYREGDE
jgi:hypothetical protein